MFRWLRAWLQSQGEEAIRRRREELSRLRQEQKRWNEAVWQEFGDEPYELNERDYRRLMKMRSQMGADKFDEMSSLKFDIDPDKARLVRQKPPAPRKGSDEYRRERLTDAEVAIECFHCGRMHWFDRLEDLEATPVSMRCRCGHLPIQESLERLEGVEGVAKLLETDPEAGRVMEEEGGETSGLPWNAQHTVASSNKKPHRKRKGRQRKPKRRGE
jgi:hypothetical protein